jgi:hypothetical protein
LGENTWLIIGRKMTKAMRILWPEPPPPPPPDPREVITCLMISQALTVLAILFLFIMQVSLLVHLF